MFEKLYSLKDRTLESIIDEVSGLIVTETQTFMLQPPTQEEVKKYFTDKLAEEDFVAYELNVSKCMVVYTLTKTYGSRIMLSSSFDVPTSSVVSASEGAFTFNISLDEATISIDTSKAGKYINFYAGINEMSAALSSMSNPSPGTVTQLGEEEAKVKISEFYKSMEDAGYNIVTEKEWVKTKKADSGKISVVVSCHKPLVELTPGDLLVLQMGISLVDGL